MHTVPLSIFIKFLHVRGHEQERLVKDTLRSSSFGRYKPLRREIRHAAREGRPIDIPRILRGVEAGRREDLEMLATNYTRWSAKQRSVIAPPEAFYWNASENIRIEMCPDLALEERCGKASIFCVLSKDVRMYPSSVAALLSITAQLQRESTASFESVSLLDLRKKGGQLRYGSPTESGQDTTRIVLQANELARLRSRLQESEHVRSPAEPDPAGLVAPG